MRNKVAEVNLEIGNPVVDVAIQKMKNELTTHKMQGYKAVILIHGYGSTGVGGSIRIAVRRCLDENSMRGIVREFIGGEQWVLSKRSFISMCKSLENYEGRIANNEGVTVVVLR